MKDWLRTLLLCGLAAVIPLTVTAFQTPAPTEPVAELQRKVSRGEVKLDFAEPRGYLDSVLKALNIPLSSQVFVFSRSSFQLHLISPSRPRSMYFTDEVYVGYAQGGDFLELGSVDPKLGPIFYTLKQERTARPRFEVPGEEQCLVCHDSAQSGGPIPRLLMLSVLPDATGTALGAKSVITNDQSPINQRWGGWYVTGTHGRQRHLGNLIVRESAQAAGKIEDYAARTDLSSGANVTSLNQRFDVTPYPSAHSDIVALMILGHQTHLHNLFSLARFREAAEQEALAERIVRTMFFVDAAPLTDRISGTTTYGTEFMKLGPFDKGGRTLRELDLNTRLFRYPLSYLIYSKAFDALPANMKSVAYRRMWEVLTGTEKSAAFAHLSDVDRQAILEILQQTKPDFVAAKPAQLQP